MNLTQKVAHLIVEDIHKSGMNAHDALPSEADLSKKYGVSRTVIRESLAHLTTIGIVDKANGRKPRVAEYRAEIFEDILQYGVQINQITTSQVMEARRGVEVEAAGLAAKRRTDEHLDRLSAILTKAQDLTGDQPAFIELDYSFHLEIAKATGNPVFVYMISALRKPIFETIKTSFHRIDANPNWLDHVNEDHKVIFEMISAKKADRAAKAMRAHIDRSKSTQNRWEIDS